MCMFVWDGESNKRNWRREIEKKKKKNLTILEQTKREELSSNYGHLLPS